MARTGELPDPLKRRHLLEDKLDPAKALAIADLYLEEGRTNEALAFLVKAEARDRLEEMRDRAVADGDPFLLRQTCEALREEPGAERWRATAQAARAAGREAQANDAERQAHLHRND